MVGLKIKGKIIYNNNLFLITVTSTTNSKFSYIHHNLFVRKIEFIYFPDIVS